MTTADHDQALSVVGYGLVAWLTDHGPATVGLLADRFSQFDSHTNQKLQQAATIAEELRHLETLGHVRRVPYDNTGQRQTLWAAVAQPATTIHIQRPTENPL